MNPEKKNKDSQMSILGMKTIPEDVKNSYEMLKHLKERVDNKEYYNYEYTDIHDLEQYKL